MKKKITIAIMIIVLLFGGIGLYILKQHSFDMAQQAVEIQTPQGKLAGTFVLPKNVNKLENEFFTNEDNASNYNGNEILEVLLNGNPMNAEVELWVPINPR
ncbi:hypothetical protein M3201_07075 [Paenibacillus motobuensis]|uniref:hypothetical protein n=1 Tax=Paenibacillus TaxID=44249 RepID=UPI0020403BCC|nr:MULTISPECIES: hypothetical protein [Paenibacillus]MCM3039463.1 hypothetical protein [Paenibacillus lutimineralis]MCM3646567.1 hypothetical protein [Paenibacillus motobuensis]